MKRILLPVFTLVVLVFVGVFITKLFYISDAGAIKKGSQYLTERKSLKEGDIIFQISLSSQSQAIQKATKSEYSHCGIVYKNKDEFYVYEAVQPVKLTPLDKWIARGKDKHYVVKRLKDANNILTPKTLVKMKKEGEKFMGKNYDFTFEWCDEKMYCSELIWKIYKRAANIEVGKLQKLREFDLTDKVVKQKIKERYGNNIPIDETVISPASIFDSELLTEVDSN